MQPHVIPLVGDCGRGDYSCKSRRWQNRSPREPYERSAFKLGRISRKGIRLIVVSPYDQDRAQPNDAQPKHGGMRPASEPELKPSQSHQKTPKYRHQQQPHGSYRLQCINGPPLTVTGSPVSWLATTARGGRWIKPPNRDSAR